MHLFNTKVYRLFRLMDLYIYKGNYDGDVNACMRIHNMESACASSHAHTQTRANIHTFTYSVIHIKDIQLFCTFIICVI